MRVLLGLVLVLAACSKGDALVVVSLDSVSALSGITRLAVTATVGTTTRSFDVTPTAAISIPPGFDFGVRVPPALGSSLQLAITAYAGTTLRATVTGETSIAAGRRTTLPLVFGGTTSDGGFVDLTGRDFHVPEGADLAPVDLLPPPGSDLTVEPDLLVPCDESTCAPCSDCGSGGACTKLVLSMDDDKGQTCQGGNTCSATGGCKIRQGFSCNEAAPGDCATGNCVDGVCCNVSAAMCGQCQQCNKVGSEGTCTNATAGTDPDGECGVYNCGGNGQCKSNCTCAQTPDLGTQPCNNALDGYSGSGTTPDCKLGYYCVGSGYTCAAKRCSGGCGYFIECGNNQCSYPSLMCSC